MTVRELAGRGVAGKRQECKREAGYVRQILARLGKPSSQPCHIHSSWGKPPNVLLTPPSPCVNGFVLDADLLVGAFLPGS